MLAALGKHEIASSVVILRIDASTIANQHQFIPRHATKAIQLLKTMLAQMRQAWHPQSTRSISGDANVPNIDTHDRAGSEQVFNV